MPASITLRQSIQSGSPIFELKTDHGTRIFRFPEKLIECLRYSGLTASEIDVDVRETADPLMGAFVPEFQRRYAEWAA